MEREFKLNMKGGILMFIGLIIGVIAVVIGAGALMAWIFMLLWNFTVVAIFALPVLTFWKAWALMILLGILASIFRRKKSK